MWTSVAKMDVVLSTLALDQLAGQSASLTSVSDPHHSRLCGGLRPLKIVDQVHVVSSPAGTEYDG